MKQKIVNIIIMLINYRTKLIQYEFDFLSNMDVTECCNVGPIVNENYCPKCGRKITKTIKL